VRPLGQFTYAVRELAAGRFGQRIAEDGQDEIGELARSFNAMSEKLRDAQQELLERNRLLAEEVERRRRAEDQLASQLKFLATLMNELPEPVFYKNAQGIYLGCNRAFEEFYGIPRDKIVGHRVDEIFPEEEARVHLEADGDLFTNPGTCQYELPVMAAGVRPRQAIYKKTTYQDSSGHIGGLVGVMIDVTHEREIDQMRREFVSTTAHEFQTPLAAILGFCELLQLPEGEMSGNREECLGIIHERAEFLSRLVDQFLDVSRIEAGRDLPLNLGACQVDQLVHAVLRNQRGNRQRFEVRFPENCPAVLADEDRISQVIENLVSNAVKYSPPEGRITLSGTVEKRMLRIAVADEGIGLSEELREKIFDKFFRVDSRETAPSGTGLGLYITRAIVEAHGGHISACSHCGQGTTFTFTLPLLDITIDTEMSDAEFEI
jgi:PAS domain S-box-containing protein